MSIKSILVPVDGSEHADKAVEFASDLAARWGAELNLLHVHLAGHVPKEIRKLSDKPGEERPGVAMGAAYVPGGLPREVIEDIGQKLLERAKKTAEKAGAKKVKAEAVDGPVSKTLLDHAKKKKADMIVMGSRGLGDLQGLLIGSTSHKVQQLAECTVVTVK